MPGRHGGGGRGVASGKAAAGQARVVGGGARRAFREEIEVRTDELERPVLDALGDDLDELLDHLDPWSEAIIAAGSYPKRIKGVYNVGGGPHFGSGLTIDTAGELFINRS